MSVIIKDVGIATAYGYAKSKGYTGTEEEFAELMAAYGTVAQEALDHSEDAEAWAVGERGGTPVESSDGTYENNAKHYAGQAAGSAREAAGSASAASGSASDASGHADSAGASAGRAEAFAAGTVDGTPVEEGQAGYQNNALYFAGLANTYQGQALGYKNAAAESAAAAARSVNSGGYITMHPEDEHLIVDLVNIPGLIFRGTATDHLEVVYG